MDETKFKETRGLHSGRRSQAPTSYISGYCDYFIGGYWWLLMVIISMPIVTILLVDIDGY
jgi:hypothetical protein